MLTATKQDIAVAEQWLGYQQDPIGFETDILDVNPGHIWPKMREVAESVRDHQLTAVPAGHSVSKTYGASGLAVWFKSVFNPSTVITTAPSDNQVRNQLWREIHTRKESAKCELGGNLTSLMWDCKPSKSILKELPPAVRGLWEINFAVGFSTTADTASEHATKMQGWHNDWILVILDEAAGLLPPIWKAVIDGLIINPRCKVLAIGNPTDPYCIFADVCRPGSGWNVVRVSVRDTPNYKACKLTTAEIIEKLKNNEKVEEEEIIPHVAGKVYEARIIKDYGENSNEHKYRCLGEFPDYAEGVIWGPEFGSLDRKGHIGDYPWIETEPVYTFGDYGTIYTAIGFIQFIQGTIRMIDYFYDDIGIGVPGLCRMLDETPYSYARKQAHWCGPDYHPKTGSNRKTIGTGTTVLSEFKRLGYRLGCCLSHDVGEGIKVARSVIPLMRIGYECSDFVDSMRQYKFKKNLIYSTDAKPAYSTTPQETPHKHPADMLRHLSWIYRNQLVIDRLRIGIPKPLNPMRTRNSDPYHGWRGGR